MKNINLKRRVLITGANGLLGQSIIKVFSQLTDDEILATSIEDNFKGLQKVSYKQLDITNKKSIENLVFDFLPNVIINTAAYTNVDGAESHREECWKLNVMATKFLAKASVLVDAKFVHISSDYIFDGIKGPYSEIDKPNPVSYYGRSKFAGENEIFIIKPDFLIIRTNVLFGSQPGGKKDFVEWVVESLNEKKEINIVTDQFNNPTYSEDLAMGILLALNKNKSGIYNLAGIEIMSRYDFTMLIADVFNLDKSKVNRVLTSELKQAAKRPLNSGLIILKAQSEFGYSPGTLKHNLEKIKNDLYGATWKSY